METGRTRRKTTRRPADLQSICRLPAKKVTIFLHKINFKRDTNIQRHQRYFTGLRPQMQLISEAKSSAFEVLFQSSKIFMLRCCSKLRFRATPQKTLCSWLTLEFRPCQPWGQTLGYLAFPPWRWRCTTGREWRAPSSTRVPHGSEFGLK